ncbi:hypothetical protein PENSPDRAFT_48162 [Peniophora sp. CONT]|nr:hypothetical protein PENSPDRAFT_48162 [Peniophora sp. CONT]
MKCGRQFWLSQEHQAHDGGRAPQRSIATTESHRTPFENLSNSSIESFESTAPHGPAKSLSTFPRMSSTSRSDVRIPRAMDRSLFRLITIMLEPTIAAHDTGVKTRVRELSTSHSRLEIGQELVGKMKGAMKAAVVALGIAAQATHNVAYLGAISTALTEFINIQDEVDMCKDECRATMAGAKKILDLIDGFREKCNESGRGDAVLDASFCDAFAKLERIVFECIITLQMCKVNSERKRDRVRIYFERSKLADSVKECSSKMGKALQQFNTMLQAGQVVILEDLRLAINELRDAQSSSIQQSVPATSYDWPLRIPPLIFYGRESEVNHAVGLITHQAPARVAILGSAGIGKTSIALSVLHHPEVEALYGGRRCFVSCEALITAEGAVRALAAALNLRIEDSASAKSAQRRLLAHLQPMSGIVCLDNLETLWDMDTAAVEGLLIDIASLPSIALLITSRVTDTPLIAWSSPPLAPIAPFSLDAALRTWDAICPVHDEYAIKLLGAVDCMPLAVTLLGRRARTESARVVWERWEAERDELIRSHGGGHRLNDLGVSIQHSLRALESHWHDAIDVLGIISLFYPNGISDHDAQKLDVILREQPPLSRYITLLIQYSLVYIQEAHGNDSPVYRVLSPIRHYVMRHHPISHELSDKLTAAVGDPLR